LRLIPDFISDVTQFETILRERYSDGKN